MQFSPYYRIIDGSDSAVLMIHGIVGSPAHFKDLLPLIGENCSIYNILLDGHGGQAEDFAHTSMKKWKAQVSAQLEEILQTHQKVVIVAHSMGTLFAIREAIRHPDAVKGLFLLSVPLVPRVTVRAAWNSVLAALGLAKPGSLAMAMLNDCGVHLTPKLWKYFFWIPRFCELIVESHRIKKQLPQLTVPTRAYTCGQDELVAHRACKFLKVHPHIQVTHLPASGHFTYSQQDLCLLQSDFKKQIEHM